MNGQTNPGDVVFHEDQYFDQWWFNAAIGVIAVGELTAFLLPTLLRRHFRFPWSGQDLLLVILLLVILAVIPGILLPLLFFKMHLTTIVTAAGIRVRFVPFKTTVISFDTIASCQARQYSPLGEYGGWGIRYSFRNGKAFNVKGDRGVQLEFKDGKKLLIGSQRAETLAEAIRRFMV
jgi:hypothetical protein